MIAIKTSPLVSIIVPVYNVKKYIRRCFLSLENQTYTNTEIILVDDGSTDGSEIICDEFAKKHKNVIVKHQKNQGLSSARNAGIRIAKGDYITFIDSDDTVEKDFAEKLIKLIKSNEAELAICAHREIRDKKVIRNFGKGRAENIYDAEKCLKDMLEENGFLVTACAKLYKSELFKNIKFPVGKLHEDLGTTYKTIMRAKKIVYTPEPLYNYHQNNNSIVHQKFNEKKMDIISQTDDMCDEILKQYPKLVDTCICRKVQARFSVLHLMVNERHLSMQMQEEKKLIIKYLKNHKSYILGSKKASKRLKISMLALNLGETFFKISWNFYSRLFK